MMPPQGVLGDSRGVLFSHPKDFTSVCPTELGPDKRIKLIITYPASIGRNFDELLRVIDSLQLTTRHQVATPVDWRHGEEVVIVPSIPTDEAREMFPDLREVKPYLRLVRQPE